MISVCESSFFLVPTSDEIEMIYFFLKAFIETICDWFTFDSALGNKNARNVFHSLECISTGKTVWGGW